MLYVMYQIKDPQDNRYFNGDFITKLLIKQIRFSAENNK